MTDIVERANSALHLSTGVPTGCARYYLAELIAELVAARSEVLRLAVIIETINREHAIQIIALTRTCW